MKKTKNLLFVTLFMISMVGYGQFESNNWALDGSTSYTSQVDVWTMEVGIGKAIAPDQVIGFNPGFVTDFEETDIILGFWYDKYRALDTELPLYFVWRGSATYSGLGGDSFRLRFAPGFAFQPTEKWLLTARFLSGSIQYFTEGETISFRFGTVGNVSFAYTF